MLTGTSNKVRQGILNCELSVEFILIRQENTPFPSVLTLDHCLHDISTKVALYKIYGDFGTGAKFRSC